MGGMVVGQARFLISSESPLWQRLQALDFQAQGLMAAGLISFGTPYNCTGASLAYTREAYDNVNGWAGVNHLISGDDELLMSKMSDAGYRIIASPHPQCVVKTTPVETLKDLWQQRIRWGSKGLHYKPSKILVLSGVFLFYLMLVLTPIGLYLGGSFPLFALLFGFKLTLDAVILLSGNKLYNDTFYWAEYILMALLHPVFIVALAIGGAFSSFEWKGQTFKQTSAQ